MKLLDKYVAKAVVASIVLVTLTLTILYGFILFVDQLNDIGKGDYTSIIAACVVLLSLPNQVYLFFPVASLLGCLVGLGVLAQHRELIIMRSAGLSIIQITYFVFRAALILILLVTFIGETWVPHLSMRARDVKMQAISGGQTLRTSSGVWLRTQHDFLMLGHVVSNEMLDDVLQFHFNKMHQLTLVRKIKTIEWLGGQWIAHSVSETHIYQSQTRAANFDKMIWDVALNPQLFKVSQSEPDEMSLLELRRYLKANRDQKQSIAQYQLAYWQRLIQPLTTLVMMLLAIPFIFGPLRSSTMGSKLLAGASVGFGFHLVNRFFGPVSQVYQWPVEIAAIAPTCVFALIGVYLMRKIKT